MFTTKWIIIHMEFFIVIASFISLIICIWWKRMVQKGVSELFGVIAEAVVDLSASAWTGAAAIAVAFHTAGANAVCAVGTVSAVDAAGADAAECVHSIIRIWVRKWWSAGIILWDSVMLFTASIVASGVFAGVCVWITRGKIR